jgi:hypothetical protein
MTMRKPSPVTRRCPRKARASKGDGPGIVGASAASFEARQTARTSG